jgi:hypothetical protein
MCNPYAELASKSRVHDLFENTDMICNKGVMKSTPIINKYPAGKIPYAAYPGSNSQLGTYAHIFLDLFQGSIGVTFSMVGVMSVNNLSVCGDFVNIEDLPVPSLEDIYRN